MNTLEFCRVLPKIELHAHLNGSLSEKTLKSLGCLNKSVSEYQGLTSINNKIERTLHECFELFKIAHLATKNPDSVYLAAQSVIKDFADDNVRYLELRTTPRAEDGMTKEEYIESVVKAIKDSKKPLVKLILSVDRRHDILVSQNTVAVILSMRNKYPDIIKGIDLSGNPHLGCFDKELFNKAKENGLKTTIHCAEIINNDEVMEILNFGPNRIGHATFLNPNYSGSIENWESYCKKKIPAEFCLTSNVVCGTAKSYKEHHMQEWIKNGLPFSINTDDKGVFCTSLSEEYEHAQNNFNLSNTDLWTIAYNAIDHSFASIQEKALMKKELKEWKTQNQHQF
ncbi:hypothetical protein NQ317_014596 [Molorchus minor]|uniref:Adenosine deaminase domain-containing protein n=1 Tax=Molorchus minor TaxID=1323400 RepID=A0ABQ9IZW1_9CUCU|nr:hypothetical protein NQ317_014596 [Molorchus minor]